MRRLISALVSVLLAASGVVLVGAGQADAGRFWWLIVRPPHGGIVDPDGSAYLEVTYRCRLPHDRTGTNEVYSTLTQRQGSGSIVVDERLDRDEFWCDRGRHTVGQYYGGAETAFKRGHATLRLDVRVCTGDVTEGDPGRCIRRIVEAEVWLRPGIAPPCCERSALVTTTRGGARDQS